MSKTFTVLQNYIQCCVRLHHSYSDCSRDCSYLRKLAAEILGCEEGGGGGGGGGGGSEGNVTLLVSRITITSSSYPNLSRLHFYQGYDIL